MASRRVSVSTDTGLGESEAVLQADGEELRVRAPLGSPSRPMNAEQLRAKLNDLAMHRFDDALEDLRRPASEVLDRLDQSL